MRAGLAVSPYQENHSITKPSQTLQALLAVGHARIFFGVHETVEDGVHLSQIDAMTGKIGVTLGLIVSDHGKLY